MTATGGEPAFDLVVVGAGMAGMTAAGAAAATGMRVIVVEKESAIGGSAAISGGHIWTTPDLDGLRAQVPQGDAELGALVVEGFAAAAAWVRESGTTMSDELAVLGYGRGYRFDVATYLARCRARVESAGGSVLVACPVVRLVTEGGSITGVVVVQGGEEAAVLARWTLLAGGGFQADDRMVAQYVAPRERLALRAAPGSTGDTIRSAQEVGAALAGPLDAFYGHLVASPLERFEEPEFIRFSFFYSDMGVLLDSEGRRFTDESWADHHNAQAVARRPDGRAFLVMDRAATEEAVRTPAATGMDRPDPFSEARAAGARAVEVGTHREIGEVLDGWGAVGEAAVAELAAYNRVVTDDPEALSPGRRRYRTPVTDPPFRVAEVRSGITMTHGGLRVDTAARVLDAGGVPIPGLLAAGADAGGINDGGYIGGLATAAVLGLTAARTAGGSPATG